LGLPFSFEDPLLGKVQPDADDHQSQKGDDDELSVSDRKMCDAGK
jgi:hypothetical protein